MIIWELSEDVNNLISAINDGKTGMVHQQLLEPNRIHERIT